MFVFGKTGTKAPYAISILTLFKLSETLENKVVKRGVPLNSNNYIISVELVQKTSMFFFFFDATYN